MLKIEFKDGANWPTPQSFINALSLSKGSGLLALCFTEKSKYLQPDPREQADWLKIAGRGSLIMKRGDHGYLVRKSEAILVWRYKPDSDLFEVARYYREDYQMRLPKPSEIRRVALNEVVAFDMSFTKGFGCVPLFPYFGGTSPEPINGKSTIFYAQ